MTPLIHKSTFEWLLHYLCYPESLSCYSIFFTCLFFRVSIQAAASEMDVLKMNSLEHRRIIRLVYCSLLTEVQTEKVHLKGWVIHPSRPWAQGTAVLSTLHLTFLLLFFLHQSGTLTSGHQRTAECWLHFSLGCPLAVKSRGHLSKLTVVNWRTT